MRIDKLKKEKMELSEIRSNVKQLQKIFGVIGHLSKPELYDIDGNKKYRIFSSLNLSRYFYHFSHPSWFIKMPKISIIRKFLRWLKG